MAVAVASPSMATSASASAKAKSKAVAVPPRRLTKEALAATHNAHLKKQSTSTLAPRPVKQPVLADAYPASTKSIRELEIIPLTELKAETHHRGQGLIVKAVSAPFVGAGAVSIVEDEFGNADKLAIYNQADSSILSGVPEGCVVAVKEPYYKNNGAAGDYMICVDHPSDVILLRFTDPVIPEKLRLGPLLKTAEDWRNAADRAFIEKDFPTCVFCYTEALEVSDDDAFKAAVRTKRAGVNLLLGRYDAAKEDALASPTGGPRDWRAYYNAGRAAYGLCHYAESHKLLSTALSLSPDNASVLKEHARCEARLREEETGDYDFEAMHASLGPQSVHLDRASFLRNTRIADSPHHGRGLFATRDLRAGDLVFVEKATLMPNQYEPTRASAALYAMVVRQLCDNPSLAEPVLALHDGGAYERTGKEGTMVDGVPVVDVFLVESIRTKNCFSAPRSTLLDTRPSQPDGRMAKGLWVHAAYMNHHCIGNTIRSFVGDMLINRATKDIKAGEELFHQYAPVKPLADVRALQHLAGWGFTCQCVLCETERNGSSKAAMEKRRELAEAVDKLCKKKLPGKELIPEAKIRNVERLLKQLEDAHEKDVYDAHHLPRLTLIYPCQWLIVAHRGRKNHGKVIRYGLQVLRNFGFRVPDETEPGWDPRGIYSDPESARTSLMTIHAVSTLRKMAEAYASLGHADMSKRAREAAEFGYVMITGSKNDVDTLDK
ncbi:hypothetical protein B0J18DRAFT_241684 [Chaetomium sp. MPI-SDFR-AT-0129]|nr:hypothetical protein B0J18DRAFT_241684 [Chaetomium sp. MPI-SDFR-AT-0129]